MHAVVKYPDFILLCCITIYLSALCGNNFQAVAEEKPIFSAVIFRHGDCNPLQLYPTSTCTAVRNSIEGPGQLTKAGRLASDNLGTWLKERYGHLLPNSRQVFTISSDTDCTIESAECVLAGLFSPTKDEIYKPELKWLPVSLRTISANEDNMLEFSRRCPRYDSEFATFLQSAEFNTLYLRSKELLDYVSERAYGKPESGFDAFQKLSSVSVALEAEQNRGCTIPNWAKENVSDIRDISYYDILFYSYTEPLQRLRTGPLLNDIIRVITERINKPESSVALKLYSASDVTIVNVLNTLKTFEEFKTRPDSAAAVLFELYGTNGAHFIKIFYKQSEGQLKELNLQSCRSTCTLEKFKTGYSNILPEYWEIECQLTGIGFLDQIPLPVISLFSVGGFGVAVLVYYRFFKHSNSAVFTRILDVLSSLRSRSNRSPAQELV